MTELEFKRKVSTAMEVRGAVVQWHEDKYELNIADMSYAIKGIDGWIEFKKTKRVASGIAKLVSGGGCLTTGQREWLTKRGATGSGHVWLATHHGDDTISLIHWADIEKANGSDWSTFPHLLFGAPENLASCLVGLALHRSSELSLPVFWSPF